MSLTSFYEGDNIGGLASISIAYHTDFSKWNPAEFLPGKSWQKFELVSEAELKCRTKDSPNGVIYIYSGFFDIHRVRNQDESLIKFVGNRAVLRIENNNGEIYLIGHPDNPVTIDEEFTTGKLPKNKNGYQFNFSVNQISPAITI